MKMTLSNIHSMTDSELIRGAQIVIESRREAVSQNPEFGGYQHDAAAKRFVKDPNRITALKVILDTFKAATYLKIPANIEI